MNIQKLHIDKIRPYWRNPRNNEKAVPAVKESIKKFGYNSPIVVDKENTIIAGHTRYKALRELGYTNVPVVVLDISEDKAKQYRIADNKAAEKSDWDEDLLMFELREIEELDDMKIFFDDGEIDSLLDIANEDYDFIEDDNFHYDEDQRRAELQDQARSELANEDQDDSEFETKVAAKVEHDMRDELRSNIQDENDRIREFQKQQDDRFSKQSHEKADDYIEIQCPHCDEKYVLSKSELLRAGKLRRTV